MQLWKLVLRHMLFTMSELQGKKEMTHAEVKAKNFKKRCYERLIEPRLLEGLSYEDARKVIAKKMKVSQSRAKGIRKFLVETQWITVEFVPSIVHITDKPFKLYEKELQK